MWTEAARIPDIYVVKAGILDDDALAKFPPSNEQFTSRKPEWIKGIDGATQLKEAFHPEN
jgi:hypothetical protein